MGFKVRYNAHDKPFVSDELDRLKHAGRLVIHCPELATGLSTPRLPAELVGGDGEAALRGEAQILESNGCDVTPHYLLAAWLALRTAQQNGCKYALMTDVSPTCGSDTRYDGTFSGTRIAGAGVAAALLSLHGIKVFNEKTLPQLLILLKAEEEEAQ